MFLSRMYEYANNPDAIVMIGENRNPPFDKEIVGHFVKDEDGYFVFEPAIKQLTCKQLREASKKVSQLNSIEE